MDIACPNCAAAYRVPDALVLTRKPVRCAACGTRWVPDLPAEVSLGRAAPVETPPAATPATPEPVNEGPPLPRSIGAPREAGAEPPPVAAAMSIGPTPADVLTEAGTLIPRPAAPPPLAEPRWTPGAPRRVRGGALLPLAWAGSLLVVGGVLAALFLHREAIATTWPPFGWVARLFGG